ncbi:MAG TPA: bifunctional polysaccharide deacetylase/glycosyltransferase family 2 protein [Segeticoccus sp.]|uniref:bifunctional polysaccharide deacetylase/glycosyltransferase family 2 protein n=1 Tax=Segeticoccus sp. TaxID=2706531 RepID=UPI002D7FB3F7|nr:bifunctional polysaccharide deacetylase/glycosyltransferase family 2 protein [Segeticoccus sp.]HET8599263.1 bifunctional polysaccharide deacetylase/glycosyltransferase family 2 protein [Segeticoccus sp.]
MLTVRTPTAARADRRRQTTRPRAHWVVLAVLLTVLGLSLAVAGYVHHYGHSDYSGPPPGASGQVPAEVSEGGPVINGAATTGERTATVQPKTIALTFDDGPDPRWTRKILQVLDRHHVRATFFVVGSQVAEHPRIAHEIVAHGNEIGVHTFTHADLAAVPPWQRRMEVRWSQLAIVGATGESTSLFRPPYSSENNALDDAAWNVVREAGHHGYLTVLTTRDSRDWQGDDVRQIMRNSAPRGTHGQVVLMHDGGAHRGPTVAALDRLIPQLKAKGWRFTTVSDAVGTAEPMRQASWGDRLTGLGLIGAIKVSDVVVRILTVLLYAAAALTLLRAVVLFVAARRHRRLRARGWGPEVTDPVSVVVPAYNEEAGIEATVRSLLASDHPVEVIVVDDGSSDRTAAVVESLDLPELVLVRTPNRGKAAALNTGVSHARYDYVVMVDGDTVVEPETVRMIVQPFSDPGVGAVSGNAKVANREGLLGLWQHVEYVVGFNLDRRLFDLAGCMPTVPGAVGAFRRAALDRVGGVGDLTLAEDTDLTMSLARDGWQVVYEEYAWAWTEAPASLGALWRQRYRWCYGTLQAMWRHRGSLTDRGASGRFGRRGIGYLLLFQVLLPMFAPVIDVFALYGLVFLNPGKIILVWLAFLAVQMFMGFVAFRLDHERLRPLWSMPLQQFVYRQLIYLVVIQSVVTAFAGVRLRWQRMDRYGSFNAQPGDTRARDAQARDGVPVTGEAGS